MNVSSISTTPTLQPIQGGFNKRASNFKALETALQSGDLAGAKTAFAALQNGNSKSADAAQPTDASSPVQKDFAALQTALQNGDLSGAQTAFATLKQDFQSAQKNAAGQSAGAAGVSGHHHHHHHHDSDGDSSTQSVGTTAATTSTDSLSTGSLLNATA